MIHPIRYHYVGLNDTWVEFFQIEVRRKEIFVGAFRGGYTRGYTKRKNSSKLVGYSTTCTSFQKAT